MYFQREWVRCGKSSCWCSGARATSREAAGRKGHGPYWYGYWKEKGKLHKRYFGKNRPGTWSEDAPPRAERPSRDEVPERFEWDGRHMRIEDAVRILGLGAKWDAGKVASAYRKLVLKYHPDRAKTPEQGAEWTRIMQAVNAAYRKMRNAGGAGAPRRRRD
jgi:hypothetical protein